MKPRYYQQEAYEAVIAHIKQSYEPAVVELATGGGKSLVIAMVAERIAQAGKNKTLVLAPSKELVEQDYHKYLTTGRPASIYCASIKKCMRHDVVFGTPGTVSNSIDKFGSQFAMIIIDEADGITPTVKGIIEAMRKKNPKLRVIGLTATPFRLGTGYIYQYDQNDKFMGEHECIEPYYHKLLYRLEAHELIAQGYLTPPHAEIGDAESYDTSSLELNRMGKFNQRQVEQTFEGRGRLTSMIVADIVAKSANRNGVLIFAATVAHAYEIAESLPSNNCEVITGATSKPDRELIIERFNKRLFKYLINVSVLTVGFDAPHVDVLAILRATESVRLLQQIIGRGLRLIDPSTAGDRSAIALSEKPDCLVLDYAGNIERHCPDGDLFNPKITARMKGEAGGGVEAHCPQCGYKNEFTGRPNPERFEIDHNGYFIDLSGERIQYDSGLHIPAHMGRRCRGYKIVAGIAERCGYRWSVKACHECEHENDITARYCEACKAELVDPNEKLKLDHAKIKKDPYTATSDKVLAWHLQEWTSQKGNTTLRIDWTTEYRTFTVWYMQYSDKPTIDWKILCNACNVNVTTARAFIDAKPTMPRTITAKKDKNSGFYRVSAYNQEEA